LKDGFQSSSPTADVRLQTSKIPLIIFPYKSIDILTAYPYLRYMKRVVVIGSGPVALENATALAQGYKNLSVTILTHAATVLERQPPKIQQTCLKIAKSFPNLKLLFNRHVNRIEDKLIYFKLNSYDEKENVQEQFIEADAIVICVGFRPNSKPLRAAMTDSLSLDGYIIVNEFFQVKYAQNDFRNPVAYSQNMEKVLQEEQEQFLLKQRGLQSKDNSSINKSNSGNDENNTISLNKTTEDSSSISTSTANVKLASVDSLVHVALTGKTTDELQSSNSNNDNDNDNQNNNQNNNQNQNNNNNNAISLAETSSSLSSSATILKEATAEMKNVYWNIFAVGDIVESTEEKSAYFAKLHGDCCAANIQALEYLGPNEGLDKYHGKTHKFGSQPLIQNLPLGSDGIFFRGNFIFATGGLVIAAKEAFETFSISHLLK